MRDAEKCGRGLRVGSQARVVVAEPHAAQRSPLVIIRDQPLPIDKPPPPLFFHHLSYHSQTTPAHANMGFSLNNPLPSSMSSECASAAG
jgi:hypothetical protein